MQAKLIHRLNEINLEDGGNLKSLDIRYNATFVGKILGDTSVSLSRSKINITFLSEPESILMRYSGNFKIIDVKYKNIGHIKNIIKDIITNKGPIHCLINSAANDDRHTTEKVDEKYWENIWQPQEKLKTI